MPAIFAVIKLFERSTSYSQYLVSWVYGTALCMLFTISTFFHCSCYCVENKWVSTQVSLLLSWTFLNYLQPSKELQELASIQLADLSGSQECPASMRSGNDICFYCGLILPLADAGEHEPLDAIVLHGMDNLAYGGYWHCLSAGELAMNHFNCIVCEVLMHLSYFIALPRTIQMPWDILLSCNGPGPGICGRLHRP